MTWKFAAVILLIGCHGAKGRSDARAIVRAYEDFQAASMTDRPAALQALEAVPCVRDTCEGRDVCAKYGRSLLRAQTLIQKARELGPVDAGGNGAATANELALIVDGADDASHAAAEAEPACRAAIGRLYGLLR